MQVYAGKDLGYLSGALCLDFDLSIVNFLPRLVKNGYYVKTSTTTQAEQQHFHWSHAKITPASIGGTVHHH